MFPVNIQTWLYNLTEISETSGSVCGHIKDDEKWADKKNHLK